MSPLVRDDDEYESQEQSQQAEPIDQIAQKTVETGVSFKKMLAGFGSWLARRQLPDSAKHGLRELGQEVWYSKEQLNKMKHGGKAKPWKGTPFKSFGPSDKKKKGKL